MNPEEFVKRVVTSYEEGRGLFANKVNAEELVPSYLSDLEKALFLFYVIQLDYAMKSQLLYEGAKRLLRDKPGFFNPVSLNALEEALLAEILKEYLRPRYINEAIKRYKTNTSHILENYKGDPREIFNLSKSAKEAELRLKKFRGFGPKIGNFFIRSMINSFGYNFSDLAEITQPVDVHDIRITYLLGLINSPDISRQNVVLTKQIWKDACNKTGLSWLTFDKALWLLGSEGKPKTLEDLLTLL